MNQVYLEIPFPTLKVDLVNSGQSYLVPDLRRFQHEGQSPHPARLILLLDRQRARQVLRHNRGHLQSIVHGQRDNYQLCRQMQEEMKEIASSATMSPYR